MIQTISVCTCTCMFTVSMCNKRWDTLCKACVYAPMYVLCNFIRYAMYLKVRHLWDVLGCLFSFNCSLSDHKEQLWVWEYQTEEGSHDLFMDIGEEIRFRVVEEQFVDTVPTDGGYRSLQ